MRFLAGDDEASAPVESSTEDLHDDRPQHRVDRQSLAGEGDRRPWSGVHVHHMVAGHWHLVHPVVAGRGQRSPAEGDAKSLVSSVPVAPTQEWPFPAVSPRRSAQHEPGGAEVNRFAGGDRDHAVNRRATDRRRCPSGELSARDAAGVGDIDEEGVWFEVRIVDAEVGGEGAADDVTSRSGETHAPESGPATHRKRAVATSSCAGSFVTPPMKVTRSPLRKFGLARLR